MEFAFAILGGILSKVGEYFVEPTLRQGRYLFCFKRIAEDLKKEDENMRLAQENVRQQVEIARRNTEEIESDVQNWLMEGSCVVADVQSLKEEINANEPRLSGCCSNWGYKYKLSKRAAKQTSTLLKLRGAGKFNNISRPAILPGIEFLAPKDFMIFESTKFAFDGIIEALKDDEMSIVGVYGMGGVGKTTLVKAIGNTTKEQKIFDEVIMVVVSQVVNIMNLQDQVADSLSLKLEEKSEQGRARRLSLRLKNEKKILLILDDLWTKLDLLTIGIPFGDTKHIGCKILLTTRDERVCIAMKCEKKVQLNVLNQKEGMDLFKKHVGVRDDSVVLSDVAMKVLKECNGLPLAIVTIGSLLRDKSIDEWKTVYQKLKKSKFIDIEGVDVNVYACLKLSYDYLKGEETKFCFLLCSLFPEDHEIDLEVLLRFGLGLDLFQDADSIADARSQLQVIIESLKASCLLLGARNKCVKMHDLVRHVALWLASKGENVFMVKAGIRLVEWPWHKGIEQCTAISLRRSKIKVFPNQLVCPKLKILLLDGDDDNVSNEFFKAMKALNVVSLKWFHLSLNSLQSLTNLVTLRLIKCKLRDMSSLKMLGKLEVLSLHGCKFVELPEELRELSKLRILSIICCFSLKKIPVNIISSLSRLEELCIDGSFKAWEAEEISAESSNACLSELHKLHCLTIVALSIEVHKCLPKDLVLLKKVHKYNIRVNCEFSSIDCKSRSLAITDVEGTSLCAFKPLYENVEYLELHNIKGRCQNMVPTIDETGLDELQRLSLKLFQGVECIVDMTQQNVPSTAFSNLVRLSLDFVDLREICKGGRPPRGFLGNLETLQVVFCNRMSCFFSSLLIQRLGKLKEVTIYECAELQDVFQPEEIHHINKNPFLLSSLTTLHLRDLPNMRNIWKGPTQQVSLQSLTIVEVVRCKKLKYVFTLNLARSLLQLQQLKVSDCDNLEHIVEIKAEDNIVARDGKEVVLPKLRKLELDGLENLINFCSENYSSIWPALQELILRRTPSLVAELEDNMQIAKETLRVLRVERSGKLCSVALLKKNFENLEELKINYCRAMQMIFELEQQLSLSSLKQLELGCVEEVECLYKGPAHHLSLPNLRKLTVYKCERLRHLLSSSLARNLLQLKTISISVCGELEQLMIKDDREDHVQLPLFPNLSSIYVNWCHKLKALFPVTIAPLHLHQLASLHVEDSSQIEEIFGQKDAADMTGDTQVVLPQLTRLTLKGLESLVNFCPSGYHFIFPSMSWLSVRGCPKLTTRFSVDENGAVHAQAETPHSDNQHVVDISGMSSDDVRRTLPPYIEK